MSFMQKMTEENPGLLNTVREDNVKPLTETGVFPSLRKKLLPPALGTPPKKGKVTDYPSTTLYFPVPHFENRQHRFV